MRRGILRHRPGFDSRSSEIVRCLGHFARRCCFDHFDDSGRLRACGRGAPSPLRREAQFPAWSTARNCASPIRRSATYPAGRRASCCLVMNDFEAKACGNLVDARLRGCGQFIEACPSWRSCSSCGAPLMVREISSFAARLLAPGKALWLQRWGLLGQMTSSQDRRGSSTRDRTHCRKFPLRPAFEPRQAPAQT